MKTPLGLVVALTLVACASDSNTTKVDRFTVIAKKWQGASINEMIRTWGNPRTLDQESPTGGAGTGNWAHFAGDGDSGGYGNRRMHCEATASFDAQGIITAIDVISQNCKPDRRSNMETLRRE